MAEQKFKSGDRVQMTADTYAMNAYAKSHVGVVINYSKMYPDHVRLRRDGLTTVELWHESAWEPQDFKEAPEASEREAEHG